MCIVILFSVTKLLGNVCSTAIHGLTKNDQTPERQTTFLPGKDPVAAIGERKGDKFHNITQRTPER